MAVVAEHRRAPEAGPARRAGFELWAWLFMRLSGILLLFLAVGHVLIMHVFDTGVARVDFDFVVDRWSSPFWRTWDWMLLSLALLHGVNGTRVIVQDYVRRSGWRLAWNWAFAIVAFSLFVLGSVVVFTFDPAQFR
ncbi:MAG TPA: succinate dehydrogenase hydrophobic membrane anchor subunit [Actinomycetota bacterium]|jgi:succinate dehydrogenase / fumarate reductase membrane anchor subunit|nr:succinate dehydrogenase hydrophobic membrane anchor subunit [Actinomycetota bacterium]